MSASSAGREPECPVNAIFHDSAVPPEWQEFIELNRRWFEDKDAVRARLNQLQPTGS